MNARLFSAFILVLTSSAFGDEVLYSFEGNSLLEAPSAGWLIYNECDAPCAETAENGNVVFRFPAFDGEIANYNLWIAEKGETSPPTLWVEWRFRSSHPVGPNFYTCDASFRVKYQNVTATVHMYGDTVFSQTGDDFLTGLALDEFHTYRFESLDGTSFRFTADGLPVWIGKWFEGDEVAYLQLRASGGCPSDWIPNKVNRWDYVRYGTIGSGEQIVSTEPRAGYLDPDQHAGIDRFVVTFDQPNYAYIEDIAVEVTGGDVPQVIATRRRDNDGPETLEIVLDRPMPLDETTTFTFHDGANTHTVSYTLAVPIPATSTWGLTILALGVATAGVLMCRKPPQVQWF